jgi:hypothetical protein
MKKTKLKKVETDSLCCQDNNGKECFYFKMKDCSKVERDQCIDEEGSYVFIEEK